MALLKRKSLIVWAVIFVAVGVVSYLANDAQQTTTHVAEGHAQLPFEAKDKRKLVGAANNVFVGRVADKIATVEMPHAGGEDNPGPGTPRTQFSVEVLEDIKGNLEGTVTVSQIGGYVEYTATQGPERGKRVRDLVRVNDEALLEPGKTYLFVTNYDRENDYYQLTATGFSSVPVTGAEQRASLVREFKGAAANQINPFE